MMRARTRHSWAPVRCDGRYIFHIFVMHSVGVWGYHKSVTLLERHTHGWRILSPIGRNWKTGTSHILNYMPLRRFQANKSLDTFLRESSNVRRIFHLNPPAPHTQEVYTSPTTHHAAPDPWSHRHFHHSLHNDRESQSTPRHDTHPHPSQPPCHLLQNHARHKYHRLDRQPRPRCASRKGYCGPLIEARSACRSRLVARL